MLRSNYILIQKSVQFRCDTSKFRCCYCMSSPYSKESLRLWDCPVSPFCKSGIETCLFLRAGVTGGAGLPRISWKILSLWRPNVGGFTARILAPFLSQFWVRHATLPWAVGCPAQAPALCRPEKGGSCVLACSFSVERMPSCWCRKCTGSFWAPFESISLVVCVLSSCSEL